MPSVDWFHSVLCATLITWSKRNTIFKYACGFERSGQLGSIKDLVCFNQGFSLELLYPKDVVYDLNLITLAVLR